jgi:hypothetical protein
VQPLEDAKDTPAVFLRDSNSVVLDRKHAYVAGAAMQFLPCAFVFGYIQNGADNPQRCAAPVARNRCPIMHICPRAIGPLKAVLTKPRNVISLQRIHETGAHSHLIIGVNMLNQASVEH